MFVLDTAAMDWDPVKANTRTGKISRKFIREAELAPGVGYTSDLVKYHGGHGVFTANEQAAATWITRGAQIVTMGSDLGYLDAGVAHTRQARAALLSRPDVAAPTVSSQSPRH